MNLFRRSFMIGGLIALQLAVLLFAIWNLNNKAAYLYSILEIISIVAVIIMISSRDNPSYKLTWVIIILVFPLFGILLYLLMGTHYLSPKLRKKIKESRKINRELRYQDPPVLDRLKHTDEVYSRQALYILSLTDKPVCEGTSARLLKTGEEFFETLLSELQKAEKFIFFEYFIIAQGEMWDEIFAVLKEKAASGVEVRLIFDDVGSMDVLPAGFQESVRNAGILLADFNPFVPMLDKFMSYRDHRKITVIDGNVGFTGGTNIGDEYINRKTLHGRWKDSSLVLSGSAVWNLSVIFLDMWVLITDDDISYDQYRPTVSRQSDGYLQPFEDSPLIRYNVVEGVYMQIINTAKRYLYIMTPYLIPDNEMIIALCNAARGGVDVRIITPHIPDKWYVHAVTRSNYQQLMDCGIKIYEYSPGFIHSKMMLSDDEVGTIGSANMDYRSFYLQFEDVVWIYRSSILKAMRDDFLQTFKISVLIDRKEWRKRPFWKKASEVFLRLFAPLM